MSHENTTETTAHHDIAPRDDRLVWIDLEMTGLDPKKNVIVEIAVIITDANLSIIGEGLDLVVHATDEELLAMNPFVSNMHDSSGLTEEIRRSKLSLAEAEERVCQLITKHCGEEHKPLLAGNSIATDRTFIREYMPKLEETLHYRMIDVSSIKELARRWYPPAYYNQPEKGMSHRALADIIESIRELDYYRTTLFQPAPGPSTEEANTAMGDVVDSYKDLLEQANNRKL